MDWPLSLTMVIVVLFDYTKGFHDASNVVATVIVSRAIRPLPAILLVAFFEFLGPLLGGTAVANTIGSFLLIQDLPSSLSVIVVLCGVLGEISWNHSPCCRKWMRLIFEPTAISCIGSYCFRLTPVPC